MTFQAVVNSCW